jgi:hypothetical protein
MKEQEEKKKAVLVLGERKTRLRYEEGESRRGPGP